MHNVQLLLPRLIMNFGALTCVAAETSLRSTVAGGAAHLPEGEVSELPPSDVLERLKMGSSLVKVPRKGKPQKRHFTVSADLRELEWIPSKKRSHKGSGTLPWSGALGCHVLEVVRGRG